MNDRQIVITEYDLARLKTLLREREITDVHGDLAGLEGELDRASVVAPADVPPDVVTMNSRFVLQDLETGEEMEIALVFPDDADADAGAISILAPVGTAVIGYRQGDTVQWPVPSGVRNLRVARVLYQPEAAGDMTL